MNGFNKKNIPNNLVFTNKNYIFANEGNLAGFVLPLLLFFIGIF